MYHSNELYHFGIKGMKWGVRHDRKTSGSGRKKTSTKKRSNPSRRQKTAEGAKKFAKTAGKIALQSAIFGVGTAAKVVFSTAITSSTLAGVLVVGVNAINSPEMSQLISNIGQKAGQWMFENYVRSGIQYGAQNTDYLMEVGNRYLSELERMQ